MKKFVTLSSAFPELSTRLGLYENLYESWTYIPGEEVEVRCYTNLGSAELFLKDKNLGIKEALTCLNTTLTNSLQTTYAPCKIKLHEFKCSNHFSNVEDFYQENLHQIEVTIEDQNSNRVITDSSMLHIGLEKKCNTLKT